jgi:signal transduction histidine kinase
MSAARNHLALLACAALAFVALAMVPLRDAARWYGHPFPGILLDPDGLVSDFGLPGWEGFRQGLRYPDRVVAIDGRDLDAGPGGYRAEVWDRAVEDASGASGAPTVRARVLTSRGERELDLRLSPLDALAFWLDGVTSIVLGLLYVGAALIALAASPRGRLARTFAKTTLFAAVFLFTLFDYHTTRRLVPLFHLSFAMVPMGLFALALRLPDDVRVLRRWPWVVAVLDGVGLVLGLAMIVAHGLGRTTVGLRSLSTALLGAGLIFFVVTFLVRFARAEGDRRATMRALFMAVVPVHFVIGAAFVLAALSFRGVPRMFLSQPALGFLPLASVVALIRHDLWGSRALLSRVLMRVVIVGLTSALAVALGAGVAVFFHVDPAGAVLAASVAGIVAGILVAPALRLGDATLFQARAAYKPTIEQLSEELTALTVPEQVGLAVERTVKRWLPCDHVEFRPKSHGPAALAPDSTGIRNVSRKGAAERATRPDSPTPTEELTIDVLFQGCPLALLRVGKKRGGALFTSEDLDLLHTIANQAALALAHAYAYAELELLRRQQAAAWRGEREALVETVAAEIAHEVRYPINFFRSLFQRGQRTLTIDTEDVDIGCDEVERLERLVSGLSKVAVRRLERRESSVEELVAKAERLLRDQLAGRALEVDIAGAPLIRCDFDQATQVLVNLLSNALDAAGENGRIGVTWKLNGPSPSGFLTVWDTGRGFDGDPARVFAPWYTTKPRGTGLGLAITHRIVRAHGWTIEPERRDGRTLFVVGIPAPDVIAVGGRGKEVA